MTANDSTRPSSSAPSSTWHLWWVASRPRTLTIAITPVVVGSSLAWADGATVNWLIFSLALTCAILIQIGTNLLNDVTDFERGNDLPGRLGPLRVTAAGWATPRQVRHAAWRMFVVAVLIGLYLTWVGGPAILALGLTSIAAGWAYSGGLRPVSHTPYGELFVFVFFGLIAVGGSYYLQAMHWSLLSFAAGTAVGAMAAAVLTVNNYRDLAGDVAAGRRTLVAVLGGVRARLLYALLVLLPFALPLWLAFHHAHPYALLALLALPVAVAAVRGLVRGQGAALNRVLAQTAMTQLAFGILLAVGVRL